MRRAQAPWTVQEVLEITDYQGHPSTPSLFCLECGTTYHVRPDGLLCLRCGHRNDAVHGNIANGRWRIGAAPRHEQVAWLIDCWHDNNGVGVHLPVWLRLSDEQYDRYVRFNELPDGYDPPRHWNHR
jgi:hypothetical protein